MLTARQEQQHPQNNNNSGKHTWKKAMPSMAFYYYTFLMVKIDKIKQNANYFYININCQSY